MIITIEDIYGERSLDLDEVTYIGSKGLEVAVLCGPRRWRLRFDDQGESEEVMKTILENLEYEAQEVIIGSWCHYFDMEDVVAVGPVLECPEKGSMHHLIIGMGLDIVSLRGSQAQLMAARSLILKSWLDHDPN